MSDMDMPYHAIRPPFIRPRTGTSPTSRCSCSTRRGATGCFAQAPKSNKAPKQRSEPGERRAKAWRYWAKAEESSCLQKLQNGQSNGNCHLAQQ